MKLSEPQTPLAAPGRHPLITDEAERLRVLDSFIADPLANDPELEAISTFAAKLCDVPIAQVSLVEDVRQQFLAGVGLDVSETLRDVSFCAHAMLTPGLMEVQDARRDPRFAENALVTGQPGIRFYAGQPLISVEGAPLGALCIIDTEPRPDGLNDFQREGLAVLGQAVMRRLTSHRSDMRARQAVAEREERLRAMLDGVPQMAWSADSDGNFDTWNARWQEVTGKAPPRTAEEWRPFIHLDDAPEVFDRWYRCFEKGEPFDVEYRILHADGSWHWVLSRAVPVPDADIGGTRWFGTVTDIDAVHRVMESHDMLSRELAHRIKNIFAVVTGLIALRVRRRPDNKEFADELVATLRALSRAHDFVRPEGGEARESLLGLLENIFAPYRADEGEERIVVGGDDACVSARAATPLALVFHELATNSAKYGALSVDDGRITLTLEGDADNIVLIWRETGGPAGDPHAEPGFGTRLVEMSVTSQLQGSWERSFAPDGLVARITLPRTAIAD